MKKTDRGTIMCIFAHPDDEAFGPAGTIAKLTKTHPVYLICVTNGNDKTGKYLKSLSIIRKQELLKSTELLGVKEVFFMDFEDGELSNNLYHQVAEKIRVILERLKPDTIITYEMRGVSGHIDHIFCSMVSSYLYRELSYIKKILYFCAPKIESALMKKYFVYFPPGYSKNEVDLVEDIRAYWTIKIAAIKCHKSQQMDTRIILNLMTAAKYVKFIPKEEYFLVKNK